MRQKLFSILTLLLCVCSGAWAETAVATVAGTYSFGSSNIGAATKFAELSENSVFIYRNSTYATGNNGIKATSSNNSGFVFYLTSPMTLSATMYQNESKANTTTLYVKTVTAEFFQALVDGTANDTKITAPTLTESGSVEKK